MRSYHAIIMKMITLAQTVVVMADTVKEVTDRGVKVIISE